MVTRPVPNTQALFFFYKIYYSLSLEKWLVDLAINIRIIIFIYPRAGPEDGCIALRPPSTGGGLETINIIYLGDRCALVVMIRLPIIVYGDQLAIAHGPSGPTQCQYVVL